MKGRKVGRKESGGRKMKEGRKEGGEDEGKKEGGGRWRKEGR